MIAPRCSIDAGRLRIEWADRSIELDGGLLRARCRCAECRSLHLQEIRITAAPDTTIRAALPMGYGVQLRFSDGHDRGIFPWAYLAELAAVK
jgi:DUF971 family protein